MPAETKLDASQLRQFYDVMVKGRLLEERLIHMFKQDQGFFWIGGPGEEAFNVPLGLLINKGQGPAYDYFHHHYRSLATCIAMGMDPMGPILQMKSAATDPYSGGRNFSSHYSQSEWNLVPGTSPVETQYLVALGTALAQKQHGGDGITIVNGGDAGTAEGDFASCLIWSSRPGQELPLLIIVTNNQYGISTTADTQHSEKRIADRAIPYGIKHACVDGLDPEASHSALSDAMEYVRTTRKPFLLEASVSRLYGHSSASGACFNAQELDPVALFEAKLLADGVIDQAFIEETRSRYDTEFKALAEEAKSAPAPDPQSIYDYTYHQQTGKVW